MSSNNGRSDQSALLYKAADLARKNQLGLVLSIEELQKLEESCQTLATVAGEGLIQFIRQSQDALNDSAPDAKPDPPASQKASKKKARSRSSAGDKATKKKTRKKTSRSKASKKKTRTRINKRTKLGNVPNLDKTAVSYLMNTMRCKTVGDVVRLDQEKVWQRAVPVVVKLRALTTKSR